MEEQSNEALWYVVHTYSGYENKVATDLQTMVENRRLQDLICDIKVPTEMVPEIKDGKERMVEHKLFPGYVLVKMVMNDDTWYVVRNTRGCTGFVGPASKPVPLTAEEVEKMGVEKAAPLTVDFNVGDTVQITAGPLEGFMGLVEGIDTESFKVKLKVPICLAARRPQKWTSVRSGCRNQPASVLQGKNRSAVLIERVHRVRARGRRGDTAPQLTTDFGGAFTMAQKKLLATLSCRSRPAKATRLPCWPCSGSEGRQHHGVHQRSSTSVPRTRWVMSSPSSSPSTLTAPSASSPRLLRQLF